MTDQPTRPPATQPGDTITMPGGYHARVIDAFVSETPAHRADGKRYAIRCGVVIVEPRG